MLEHLGNEYSIPRERTANRFGRDSSGAYSSAPFTALGKAVGRGMRRGADAHCGVSRPCLRRAGY